jgi:hypothetical protein
MGFCSAVTLAFATIFSLVAVALLAIAFSTDEWLSISVDRVKIKETKEYQKDEEGRRHFNSSALFYTRSRGLFRECFVGEKAEGLHQNEAVELYMSPVETWCRNLDYYIPVEDDEIGNFSSERMTKIHMGRSMVALFIVSFVFMFSAFITGVVGCWRTSPSNITASAIFMLLACLFSAGAMGLWHGVEHYEKEKIAEKGKILSEDMYNQAELFTQDWPQYLKDNTEFNYSWSYIVSWVGVGLALISSILFSLAAVCIRTDKEHEDAMNMQYLMPVYHQKQQPYGPYGYAAYPGPYYGSQYGPQYGY